MLSLVTAPAEEPVSLVEAKVQLRLDDTVGAGLTDAGDDDWITRACEAVRERCEAATDRALITQTWDLVLDAFPCDGFIEIPKPPLQSITYLKYRDTAGVLKTWDAANYIVEAPAGPRCRRGRLSLAYGISWPSTYGQAGDVTVRFVCGYGDEAGDVPAILRQAQLMDLGTLYVRRESLITGTIVAEVPMGVREIYRGYRAPATQRLAA